MDVSIGELDRRITIVAPGGLVDTGLSLVPGPETTIAEVWARRRDISDRERIQGGISSSQIVSRFVIRWHPGIPRTGAILCDGLRFSISGIKELGRRGWLEITASAEA